MNECRIVFQSLHEIRHQGVFKKHGHCAIRIDVFCGDGLAVTGVTDNDLTDPALQIVKIARKTKDRHDLGCHSNVEPGFAREAVGHAAERACDRAQGPIIHVEDTAPCYAA